MDDFLSGIFSGTDTSDFLGDNWPSATINYGGLQGVTGFDPSGFDTTYGTSGGATGSIFDGGGIGGVGGILSGLGGAASNFLSSGGPGILAGMYSLQQANDIANRAAAAADPFASQRGQYQTMLSQLMTNPSSFNLSPAAQAQMRLGTENLQRSAAAQGFLGSGNILASLQQYGQDVASKDYWNYITNLSTLSGAATSSPAAAGTAISGIFGNQQQALAQIGAAMQYGGGGQQTSGGSSGGGSGLGGIGTVIGSAFGGPIGGAIGGLIGGLF